MVDPHEDDIELVPSRYDAWHEQYREERDRVRATLDARALYDHGEPVTKEKD